jgi:hypothetical protein
MAFVAVKARAKASTYDAAREIAENLAGTLASRTMMYAKCPQCGARAPGGGWYRVQVVLGALGFGGVVALLVFLLMLRRRVAFELGNWTFLVVGVVGAFVALQVYRKYRRAWVDVGRRVTWKR